jgi:hypothetical protein
MKEVSQMKSLVMILFGTMIFLTAGPVSSAVISFDDIGTGNTEWVPGPPRGYKGFLWEYLQVFDGPVYGDVQAIKESQIASWYSITWSYPSPSYGVCLRDELNKNILRIRSVDGAKFNFVIGKFRSIGYSTAGATFLAFRGYKDGSTIVTHTYASLPSGSWAAITYGDLTDLEKLEISGERVSGINSMWSVDDIELVPAKRGLTVDFDGDTRTDISIYRTSTGAWFFIPSSTNIPSGVGFGGDPSDIPVPGDYDGDEITDYAIYRLDTGAWFIYPSETEVAYGVGFGGDASDKPVPGDYDGDGTTDFAIYRTTTGAWFIYPSSTGASGIYGAGFGGDASDKPVPADYDGDGKTDIAIYRASTGAWFIYPSEAGASGIYGVGFGGNESDKPVPADYDGDGKTDIAIYRTNIGAWFIYPSSTGASGIYGVGFGGDATDKAVPGDYDGDRKADLAIYRANIGSWFIYPSSTGPSGIYGVGFGGDESDVPVITNPGSYM